MSDLTWTPDTARLDSLDIWEHNPKWLSAGREKRLAKSWRELSQYQTLAVGPNGEVYDGTQRVNTLNKEGYPGDFEVYVMRSSRALTDEERRRLVIESTVGTVGALDFDELAAWPAVELQGYGLDAEALAEWNDAGANLALMLEGEREQTTGDTEPQIDRAEELRQAWGVELGQLWACGDDHRIICGDCTDRAVVERVMRGEKADAVVTDPPYGIGVDREMSKKGGQQYGKAAAPKRFYADTNWDIAPSQETIDFIVSLAPEVIIWGGNYFFLPPARCCLIWDKQNDGNQFADCELAWTNLDKPIRMVRHLWNGMLRKDREERNEHPTQKPLGVFEWCVEQLSNPNIIFDPFLGSGTTLIAAHNLGRKCRGIEIAPGYVAVTLQRFKDHTGIEPVLLE